MPQMLEALASVTQDTLETTARYTQEHVLAFAQVALDLSQRTVLAVSIMQRAILMENVYVKLAGPAIFAKLQETNVTTHVSHVVALRLMNV